MRHSEVAGHIVLFVSRLAFVFAGSCFSVVFFVRSKDTSGSPHGICYVLELERLARLCLGLERDGGNVEPPGTGPGPSTHPRDFSRFCRE